jgi:glyoxylase-like metal-dependent hydrolase (beta-lactamase superfamily II)
MTFHINGERVVVIAFDGPGHTGGDAVVYFSDADVLCVGDYYFAGGYPIIDVEGGGSFDGYFENLGWLLDEYDDVTLVIPGHGRFNPEPVRAWTVGDMRAWRDRLLETISYIREQKTAGKSVEEVREEGLPERFAALDRRPRFVSEAKWVGFVWEQSP